MHANLWIFVFLMNYSIPYRWIFTTNKFILYFCVFWLKKVVKDESAWCWSLTLNPDILRRVKPLKRVWVFYLHKTLRSASVIAQELSIRWTNLTLEEKRSSWRSNVRNDINELDFSSLSLFLWTALLLILFPLLVFSNLICCDWGALVGPALLIWGTFHSHVGLFVILGGGRRNDGRGLRAR